jgi:hypothetical protein
MAYKRTTYNPPKGGGPKVTRTSNTNGRSKVSVSNKAGPNTRVTRTYSSDGKIKDTTTTTQGGWITRKSTNLVPKQKTIKTKKPRKTKSIFKPVKTRGRSNYRSSNSYNYDTTPVNLTGIVALLLWGVGLYIGAYAIYGLALVLGVKLLSLIIIVGGIIYLTYTNIYDKYKEPQHEEVSVPTTEVLEKEKPSEIDAGDSL